MCGRKKESPLANKDIGLCVQKVWWVYHSKRHNKQGLTV